MSEIKIRAYELKIDDLFVKGGTQYRVINIADGKIFYGHNKGNIEYYIGGKSMEFIMWVGRYKPKERPIPKTKRRSKNPKKSTIPVKVTTKEGEYVGSFLSIRQASRVLSIDYKYIERYIKKELVKEKYPFKFEKIIVT